MIEVRDLWKSYGSFHALLGVTFHVARGEILGFLGPNGAGKTTAMKIMTGFIYPSSGTVTVGGVDVVEDSLAVRRQIGYLPEHTPLYPDLTVAEYLRFCASLRGMEADYARRRLDVVADLCSLRPKWRAPIKTLSKGYRQRVGIAQALLHEPEVLILDEPTVGLDPNQVAPIRDIIRDVGRERTVILCSHILPEVEAVCGRVVIINEGRIVGDGTPRELAQRVHPGREASLEEVFRTLTAPQKGAV
ncbi:MAG TPA: ATP-binding cassette domain-containing protein [Planctomycetota bacterium]|nr:ATP-binding cassette domain-containing protein [Planctomycetota bacterium]